MCNLNLEKYPYDTQNCPLNIYDSHMLPSVELEVVSYFFSQSWSESMSYSCEWHLETQKTETVSLNGIDIPYVSLKVRRKTTFYTVCRNTQNPFPRSWREGTTGEGACGWPREVLTVSFSCWPSLQTLCFWAPCMPIGFEWKYSIVCFPFVSFRLRFNGNHPLCEVCFCFISPVFEWKSFFVWGFLLFHIASCVLMENIFCARFAFV